MPDTVFYAWQSDLPNNTNRGFIRDAIERALKQINSAMGVEDALRPDQDIENVSSSPSIADTIFEKIDTCRVFVPDSSIVTGPNSPRSMPNANVMIEYGRATKSLGDRFIVPVFNSAFGNWETDLPFDIRHKLRPITYTLPANHTSEQRKVACEDLVKRLVKAISAVQEYGQLQPEELPSIDDFSSMRQHYFDLRPRDGTAGRMIGFWCGLIPTSKNITLQRPFEHPELFERTSNTSGTFPNTTPPLILDTIDNLKDGGVSKTSVTPTKEAGERRWYRHSPGRPKAISGDEVCLIRVDRNSSILLAAKSSYLDPSPSLYASWIMADVANALRIVERVREKNSQPELEYAMIVELRYDDHLDKVEPVKSGEWRF